MSRLKEYQERYKRIHTGQDGYMLANGEVKGADSKQELFSGIQFMRKFPRHIEKEVKRLGRSISLMDFGCGKAQHLWRQTEGYPNGLLGTFGRKIHTVSLYDPGVPEYELLPDTSRFGKFFDVIGCADVMEHVPEEDVQTVLRQASIYLKDGGLALFAISANKAFKSFLDGENLHCTIKDIDWWAAQLRKAGFERFVLIHTDDALSPPIRTMVRGVAK